MLMRLMINQVVPLYIQLLDHLKTTVSPTQAMLEDLRPLLLPPLERACAQHSQESTPNEIMYSFADFWNATFRDPTEPLDLGDTLMTLIAIFRDSSHLIECNDTQSDDQHPSNPSTSLAPPPPAQVVPSGVPGPPSPLPSIFLKLMPLTRFSLNNRQFCL